MVHNVFILDESRRWFLEEGRIDPMTRERYKPGDRVVVCADCSMVSLETTWNDCGGCTAPGCGCKASARRFLRAPVPKTQAESGVLNRIILKNGGVVRQKEPADPPENVPRMVVKARRFYD